MAVGRANWRALIATLGGVFSMFLGLGAAAQDGHYGVDHDKWHHEEDHGHLPSGGNSGMVRAIMSIKRSTAIMRTRCITSLATGRCAGFSAQIDPGDRAQMGVRNDGLPLGTP